MIFINDRIVVYPSKLYLEQFIKDGLKNSLKLEKKLICIADNALKDDKNSNIIDKNISYKNCRGCLCCVESQDSDGFNNSLQPINKSIKNYDYKSILKKRFQSSFSLDDQPKNFINYYSQSEVINTTPVACHILYRLSKSPNQTFFRSDPYSSININTPQDPRDGKLDLVIFNSDEKKILIIESKKNLKSLIRDKKRDQWNKYKNEIQKISNKYNIQYSYLILIGGNEEEIYPKDSIDLEPSYDQRDRFYEYMKDKKFVSLNFLHSLLMLSLTKKNIYWENIFFKESYKGLLSGGYIDKNNNLNSINF